MAGRALPVFAPSLLSPPDTARYATMVVVELPTAALRIFPSATCSKGGECYRGPSIGRQLSARPAHLVSRSPCSDKLFVKDTWQLRSGFPSNHWSRVEGVGGNGHLHSGRGHMTRSQMESRGGEDGQGATPVSLERDDVSVCEWLHT